MEEEKREHDMKMKKMEAEMEQVFEMKVKEKKQKLKDSEAELTRRHEERKKVWPIPFFRMYTILCSNMLSFHTKKESEFMTEMEFSKLTFPWILLNRKFMDIVI